MRGAILFIALFTSPLAFCDALIIDETPKPFAYEPSMSLEFLRDLSLTPPQLAEPQQPAVPLRDNAFLSHAPSGELAIDVPELKKVDSELQQRQIKKYDAQQFVTPGLKDVQDPTKLGVRLIGHAIQQTIDDRPVDTSNSKSTGPTSSASVASLNANLAWFQTAGFQNQFDVQLRAADSRAALNYKGLADASLSYQTEQKAVGFELKRRLIQGVDVVYAAVKTPLDDQNLFKISWNF